MPALRVQIPQVLKLSVMRYLDFGDDDYEDDIEEGGVLEGDELVNDTFTPEDLEPVEEAAGKPVEEEFTSEALVRTRMNNIE